MVKEYKVPWAVWREPEFLNLTFPDSWDIEMCTMNGSGTSELSEVEIKNAIMNPIGSPKLSELAEGKENAVIVIDDMTRPTEISKIIPFVLEELKKANIEKDQITILLAIGAHRPMNRQDCILKLGVDIVDTYRIENHHPYINLKHLGKSSAGTPIYVNKTYLDADLKIAIGGVIPHTLAGFGGGAKIVLPGVCGIKTLAANHTGRTGGIGTISDARRDIEDIAKKVGLDYSINVILTDNGKIARIFSGDFIDAHREAMKFGLGFYSTKVSSNYKICFLNTYPEDSELEQAQYKSINFLFTAPSNLIDQKGAVVMMTSSYEGRGYHSLVSETGSMLHHNLKDRKGYMSAMGEKKVYLFSPNVNEYDKNHLWPESVKLFNKWEDLILDLKTVFGDSLKAAIIPSSIQLSEEWVQERENKS
ncbi:MAG: lactate racemase domain-containing protein [Promethearchaeota archaeon]|jgi:nickel-dependent lactate racemase